MTRSCYGGTPGDCGDSRRVLMLSAASGGIRTQSRAGASEVHGDPADDAACPGEAPMIDQTSSSTGFGRGQTGSGAGAVLQLRQ